MKAIADEKINRFRYADQLLNIVIVLLEKVKDGIVVLAMT